MTVSSTRALQTLLAVLGCIAIVAGSATVLFGVDSILGAEDVSGTVDSEMRFYAVWYVGAGALLMWSARNLDRAGVLIRAIATLLFVAGLSRALSWLMVGEPHVVSQALMVAELVLPLVIVVWHATLPAGDDRGPDDNRGRAAH